MCWCWDKSGMWTCVPCHHEVAPEHSRCANRHAHTGKWLYLDTPDEDRHAHATMWQLRDMAGMQKDMPVQPLGTDVTQNTGEHACPFPHVEVLKYDSHASVHPMY